MRALLAVALLLGGALDAAATASVEERFREAGAQLTAGDLPRAAAIYRELAAEGNESASLYWNWSQAAQSRGAVGEALWTLLRAREMDSADPAIEREIGRVRDLANLDPAELAPEPLAAVARFGRRYRLDLVAAALGALSVLFHLLSRVWRSSDGAAGAAWICLGLSVASALVPILGSFSQGLAVVSARGLPLTDAASPQAQILAILREGEVVPILAESGPYLRIQDSSGARGWALASEVWRLDRALPAAPATADLPVPVPPDQGEPGATPSGVTQ